MQKFDGGKILEAVAWLSSLSTKWGFERASAQPFLPDAYAMRLKQSQDFAQALKDLQMPISGKHAALFVSALEESEILANGDRLLTGITLERANYHMRQMLSVIGEEAETRLYLAITPQAAELYAADRPPFGDQVAMKFPSIAYEVDEAAKCLALGRSTASAFHTLRCLEAAIRAISRSLEIPDPTKGSERSWFKALAAILEKIDSKWPKATRLSGNGVLYEKWHAVLVAMQNPYRNSTMHLDETYTEAEAEHLFLIVKGFLVNIASHIDEYGLSSA